MADEAHPYVVRPSSLPTAPDCYRRWAARHLAPLVAEAGYTLAVRRPLHVGAAVGSGVHAAVGYTLQAKLTTGELGNATEAENRAEAEFMARAEFGVMWDSTTDDLPTAKKQLQRMNRSFRRYLAPDLIPLVVEQRLEADIGDGWIMSGQGDNLSGNPDALVRDIKTGTTQRANGVQYASYHGLFQVHGYHPTGMVEDFIPRAKLRDEQPPPTSTPIAVGPAIEEAWAIIDDIKRGTAEFEKRLAEQNGRNPAGAFRANPASQLCGAKWCTAFGTDFCRAHKGAK